MKKLFIFLLFSCVYLIQSCTPDFDVNAEWEEITVIYGILDASEYYHHVKVNKAFLNTNSDALLIASSMPDSSYHYDSITVQLYKLDADENIIETYSLDTIFINNKDQGLFYYPGQIIYQSDSVVLDETKNYKILVTNTRTGKVTGAITPIVNSFKISSYPSDFTIDGYIRFFAAINATIYKATINVNYQ
ncbi:MAG: hypothetical protein FVQ77_07250 [Cytophagales bacterium]|nr:hypothetical protein [Cytophagales bacterium]